MKHIGTTQATAKVRTWETQPKPNLNGVSFVLTRSYQMKGSALAFFLFGSEQILPEGETFFIEDMEMGIGRR